MFCKLWNTTRIWINRRHCWHCYRYYLQNQNNTGRLPACQSYFDISKFITFGLYEYSYTYGSKLFIFMVGNNNSGPLIKGNIRSSNRYYKIDLWKGAKEVARTNFFELLISFYKRFPTYYFYILGSRIIPSKFWLEEKQTFFSKCTYLPDLTCDGRTAILNIVDRRNRRRRQPR